MLPLGFAGSRASREWVLVKYSSLCALFAASLLVGMLSASSSRAMDKDLEAVPRGEALALASYVWRPALATTHAVQDVIDDSVSGKDALLMIVSGFVLSALQLRRKQKALWRAKLASSAA